MSPHHAAGRYAYAAFAAAAFVVYGSLYPFAFHAASLDAAIHTLFANHQMHDQPWSGLIANIALYVPLGLFCAAAANPQHHAWQRVAYATAIGTALCFCMEIAQFFDAGRFTTLTDVYPNVAGSLIGALLALPMWRWLYQRMDLDAPPRQTAALLLLCFLAYRLFPYVPTLNLHAYGRALEPVIVHPAVNGFEITSYSVIWLVVGALLADMAGRARSRWLLVLAMTAVLVAKILIIHSHLSASEIIALPIAFSGWQILSSLHRAPAAATIGAALALLILADRVLPFHWQAASHGFGWVPFYSILHGSMAVNTPVLAEKVFLYASLVWLLAASGLRYALAGGLVGAGLFAASLIETHLPGRSAEITDTLIAVGAAALLSWFSGPYAPNPRTARARPGAAMPTG